MDKNQGIAGLCINRVLACALIAFLSLPAYADIHDNEGSTSSLVESKKPYSFLRAGKEALDRGDYEKALHYLGIARKELHFIGDYVLFFMAEAYSKTGRFEDSNLCLAELVRNYPDSLLVKRARSLEVRNMLSMQDNPGSKTDDGYLKHVEKYMSDYPGDAEIAFIFGKILKNLGDPKRAKNIFRQVYVSNSAYAEQAYRELQSSDISAGDLLEKASNYIKTMEYKKAETVLLRARSLPTSSLRDDIQKKLGLALFRQKKYKESAAEYIKARDLYNAARAFYRSGDMPSFHNVLSELRSMEDKRAGLLLAAYASRIRREGSNDDALRIYREVIEHYPAMTEEALWGIAWTYYRAGDYQKASEALGEMKNKYADTRYSYWEKKCAEKLIKAETLREAGDSTASRAGDDLKSVPASARTGLKKDIKDFYSLMLHMQDINNLSKKQTRAVAFRASRNDETAKDIKPPQDLLDVLERFDMLYDMDLKKDAVNELLHASKKLSRPDVSLYISSILNEVGAYRGAIGLLSGISKTRGIDRGIDIDAILYPTAYWQILKPIAEKHDIDPFIVLSVMREESRFDPDARSIAGALGLMQIMPQTAQSLNRGLRMEIDDSAKIFDIEINITLGAYYLSALVKEFGSLPLAIAAYNAGEHKVREWLKKGSYGSYDEFIEDIPYDETKNYVKRVLFTYAVYLDMTGAL